MREKDNDDVDVDDDDDDGDGDVRNVGDHGSQGRFKQEYGVHTVDISDAIKYRSINRQSINTGWRKRESPNDLFSSDDEVDR